MDGHGSHLTDQFLAACVVQRVFISLLPAHSSHVTQPLDVGCFTPLKQYFRTALEEFYCQDFGSATSKRNFLIAYAAARRNAFSIRNIRSAWKASGLWPVNINKVLENPFVQAATPVSPKSPCLTVEFDVQGVPTPKGGQELRSLVFRTRQKEAPCTRPQREIIAKAAKALDIKNAEIALLRGQKRVLEQQIEDLRPKKRKKVAPTLGQRLVGIAQIEAVQQLAELTGANNKGRTGLQDIDLAGTFLD